MKFTKMHGTGNDYIYVYQEQGRDFPSMARKLSPRHSGVGSDGIIHLYPDMSGDFVMEMYNADGSVGSMCGNGIRCVGKYLYDMGHTQEKTVYIQTKAGRKQLLLHVNEENKVAEVTVDMGAPMDMAEHTLTLGGKNIQGTYVSMGNPHFVVMCQDPQAVDVVLLGSALEQHPAFAPEGVNVEFYSPTEEGFSMRVWERGSGETQACGTGACACFAVGQQQGILDQGAMVAQLLGGDLQIWQEGTEIFMRGEAVEVFHGEVDFP